MMTIIGPPTHYFQPSIHRFRFQIHVKSVSFCIHMDENGLFLHIDDSLIEMIEWFAARAGIADFIQPSLGPLQPNLDDFMNGAPLQGIQINYQ